MLSKGGHTDFLIVPSTRRHSSSRTLSANVGFESRSHWGHGPTPFSSLPWRADSDGSIAERLVGFWLGLTSGRCPGGRSQGKRRRKSVHFSLSPPCPGGGVLLRAIPPQLHFLLDGCLLWLFSTHRVAPVAGPLSSCSHNGPLNPPQTSVHFPPEIYYETLANEGPARHAQLPAGARFPWGEASFQLQCQVSSPLPLRVLLGFGELTCFLVSSAMHLKRCRLYALHNF